MRSSRSRPACVSELFTSGLLSREKTTVEDGERLLAFCEQHDLELSADAREAYLIRIPKVSDPTGPEDYHVRIMVQAEAFFRICRATQLWLPGTTTIAGSGDEMRATATCHTRLAPGEPWVEVGAQARFFIYYERASDGCQATPRWDLAPDIALSQVAEVLAARKALGDILADVHTEAGTMEFASDQRVIRRLNERAVAARIRN
jgi:hypothetical protein